MRNDGLLPRKGYDTFRCLPLCIKAINEGGLAPTAVNGANEEAVRLFLEGKIKFYDINRAIEYVLEKIDKINNISYELLNHTDNQARVMVKNLFGDKQ